MIAISRPMKHIQAVSCPLWRRGTSSGASISRPSASTATRSSWSWCKTPSEPRNPHEKGAPEVELSASGYLEPQLSKDTPLENFVRLTEDARRERQLRIDLGESAGLKMPRPLGAKGPGKGTKGQPFRAPQPNYGYENRFQGAIVASRPKF